MLFLGGIHDGYGGVQVLRGVSPAVPRSSLVALLARTERQDHAAAPGLRAADATAGRMLLDGEVSSGWVSGTGTASPRNERWAERG